MGHPAKGRKLTFWQIALLVIFSPLLLVVLLVTLALFVISSACLYVLIWTFWNIRGRDILLVYSDSPVWHDYVEQNILPKLGTRAVVLNWSQRTRWRLSLARMAFQHFGGCRAFNPLVVVFHPFRRARVFRFWEPFRDFKHGRPEPLRRMECDFFAEDGLPPR